MSAEPAGELVASLRADQVSPADRDKLEELIGRLDHRVIRQFLQGLLDAIDRGETVHLLAKPGKPGKPRPPAEWEGYASQLDLLAATIYNARAQSPRAMTPERWAEILRRFPGSASQCLEQARDELDEL